MGGAGTGRPIVTIGHNFRPISAALGRHLDRRSQCQGEQASSKTKKTLMELEMKSTELRNAQGTRGSDLDSRYGEIGIPAVAAALQYQSEIKTTADTRTAAQPQERWLAEIAA
jgi:hypothetical protein